MIDFTTLAIVLVITIAFCLPFFYSYHKKKKHERGLIKNFMDKADQYQLHMHTYELWRRSYIIGIDEEKKQVLYKKFQPDALEYLVDLRSVKNIIISKVEKEIGSGTGKEKVVEKLWLTLEKIDAVFPGTQLEFYNGEESMGLMGEPLINQKWHQIIKEALITSSATTKLPETRLMQ